MPGLGFACACCAGSGVAWCCRQRWAQQSPHREALGSSLLVPEVPGFGHGQKQLMCSAPQGDLRGVEAGAALEPG